MVMVRRGSRVHKEEGGGGRHTLKEGSTTGGES